MSRIDIVAVVSPTTVPAVAAGESIKEFYVLAVQLKRKDYEEKNIAMLSKLIFFIAETKGSMDSMELRGVEKAKIDCAKKLFNEMSNSSVRYHEVNSYEKLMEVMQSL